MLNQELLTQELTILTKEDAEGFQRIITALEELTIKGISYGHCGYTKYCNGDGMKAMRRATKMANTLGCEDTTPMEDILWNCRIGQPLDDDQQAFLALCKEIQKGAQV